MTWSLCNAVPVEVPVPINTGPLVNVEIPVTCSCSNIPIEVKVGKLVRVPISTPSIIYFLPEARLKFSLDFNAL